MSPLVRSVCACSCNLALSCLLMVCVNVPLTPTSLFLNRWIFGALLCSALPMTMGVAVYVCTLSSLAIAVDRYFSIVWPLVPRMTSRAAALVVAAIWLVAVVISLPLAVFQSLITPPSENNTARTDASNASTTANAEMACMESWPRIDNSEGPAQTRLVCHKNQRTTEPEPMSSASECHFSRMAY